MNKYTHMYLYCWSMGEKITYVPGYSHDSMSSELIHEGFIFHTMKIFL